MASLAPAPTVKPIIAPEAQASLAPAPSPLATSTFFITSNTSNVSAQNIDTTIEQQNSNAERLIERAAMQAVEANKKQLLEANQANPNGFTLTSTDVENVANRTVDESLSHTYGTNTIGAVAAMHARNMVFNFSSGDRQTATVNVATNQVPDLNTVFFAEKEADTQPAAIAAKKKQQQPVKQGQSSENSNSDELAIAEAAPQSQKEGRSEVFADTRTKKQKEMKEELSPEFQKASEVVNSTYAQQQPEQKNKLSPETERLRLELKLGALKLNEDAVTA